MGKAKTVGGYSFKDWDKSYGKKAKSACGGASALGAAQAWAKKKGKNVPKGINSANDVSTLISNCKAYKDNQRKQKDKNNKKDNTPKTSSISKGKEPTPFAADNAAEKGLTRFEANLYGQTTLNSLQHGFNMEFQDSTNATSVALRTLANNALQYTEDAATARTIYGEDAASWRTKYTTDAQERWNNFDSVMDYKGLTDAEKIRGEYGKDLQEIIRAGNDSVAKIQGEYSSANTRLKGEYDIAGEKIRGAAARDVAQRNKEATVFGSLFSGFWS